MKQQTLVAFYGEKKEDLSSLVQSIWTEIQQSPLKDFFIPYDIEQVHATITGLEKIPDFSLPLNLNIWEKTGRKKEMDFSGLPATVKASLPLTIQFGGFPEAFSEMKSFGQSLYQRSFQVNWTSGRVVLIGWPVDQHGRPSDALLRLRQQLYQKHQILHKYEGDNDCYLVLGRLQGLDQLSPGSISNLKTTQQELEVKIRKYLYGYPYRIQFGLDQLTVVQYTDTTLPLSNSRSRPIDQVEEFFE